MYDRNIFTKGYEMKNEPVAWINKDEKEGWLNWDKNTNMPINIPLYTQDQLEEARKLGMQQERAMWELAASTQEIMDTHPAKEHFEDEPQAEELHEILQSNTELTDEKIWEVIDNYFGVHAFNLDYQISLDEAREDAFELVKAVLRKAQEK